MIRRSVLTVGIAAGLVAGVVAGASSSGAALPATNSSATSTAAYWTPARLAAASPRDLVIDHRGLGYQRRADGSLVPHGHERRAGLTATTTAKPITMAKPGGGTTDTTAPAISNLDPAAGSTIGAAYDLTATVTDASGLRSVNFLVTYPGGLRTDTFAAARLTGTNTWTVTVNGFTDGDWSWQVVAKDASRNANTATSAPTPFTVNTGGGGGGGGVITNSEWNLGGRVQTAVGRIYFEMPANPKKTRWSGFVCSGSVATDTATNSSVIITAAHCVYDDVNKAFARNVLFIPNQAGTTGTGTDRDCSNDPLGCWVPTHGVVDVNWTTRSFPDNIPWDYAYYVVPAAGAHTAGFGAAADSLEVATGSMQVSFSTPAFDLADSTSDVTHGIGYSYDQDPLLMYCAEDMTTNGAPNWWLPNCGLSGGSSGGAWVQPMVGGDGPIISVNSWGYSNQPGMAGPKLAGTSAQCVWNVANTSTTLTTDRGIIVTC